MNVRTGSIHLDHRYLNGTVSFLVLLVLFTAAPVLAGDPFAGKIAVIDSGGKPSVVNIVRPGKSGFAESKVGDAVFVGDTIKTGVDVRVQLEMADNSIINLGPQSTMRVKAYQLKPESFKRSTVFKVLKGAIQFVIAKTFTANRNSPAIRWDENNVVVETPVAVAGVRGTKFFSVVKTDGPVPESEFAVEDGVVTIRSSDLKLKDVITLSANEMSSVRFGGAPGAAVPFTEEHRRELTNRTTPANTNGHANGQNGKQAKKPKYTDRDMERDLVAGIPLELVLERAISQGMKINEAIAAAIEIGVPAYSLVYTAITEGFSTTAVVDAAITSGAPLDDVIAAAVIAGGEIKAIIGGAQLAGAPADAVASSLANATATISPVYGYQPPAKQAGGMPTSPPPPGLLGPPPGGGGGTPSTRPASPYKP